MKTNNDCNWVFVSQSDQDTFELGKNIGDAIEASTVLGLNGTLGTGKTRLTQGIVSSIVASDQVVVVSPTFTLCIPYSGRIQLWHLDAYRLKEDEEVYELGLDEAVDDGCAIVIEWIDKIRDLVPPLDLVIDIEHESEHQRRISFRSLSGQGSELLKKIQ